MPILKFVENDGREIDFEPFEAKRFDVQPLDFGQLLRAVDPAAPSFDVVIRNAKAPVASTGLAQDGPLTLRTQMACNGPILAFGLVEGGWLPMPWAHKRIAWLDRNVVIALEKLQANAPESAPPHWLTEHLGLDTEQVSPILFALEGSKKKRPTPFEIRAELGRATKALSRLLSGANIQTFDRSHQAGLYRLLLEDAEYHAKATRLLRRAAPLVVNRAQLSERRKVEEAVLAVAREEGVRIDCLPVLALLSCVYDEPTPTKQKATTPGRAVIKPRANYTNEDAYNALADLFFLELLFNAHGLFEDLEPVLYTQDVGLAAFWTVLQPCRKHVTHLPHGRSKVTVTFNIAPGLFPVLSEEDTLELSARLAPAPGAALTTPPAEVPPTIPGARLQ